MVGKVSASRAYTIDSSIEFADVGSIRIAKISASQRGFSFELKPHDPVRRYVNVVLQLFGSSTCSQQRRSARLEPGQWATFEVGKLNIVAASAECEQFILLIPHDHLDSELDIRAISSRALPSATGASKLLVKTAICVIEELPRLNLQRAESLAQALCRLVALAIQERSGADAAAVSNRVGIRDRICHYIDSNLRDPNLSLDRVAKQLNCTKRYLHKVFQGGGESLSTYILQQRLQRCRADISNPELANLSITEIALSWGFNSVSHFSRAFRLHFGTSPRAARLNHQRIAFAAKTASKVDDEVAM
jgi:AraC-like DNA-binding protein